MAKITPFLWFNNQAEEAAKFYVSIFKNSKINSVRRYGEGGLGPKGQAMTVEFSLAGSKFVALNGGSTHHFTPAVSFVVTCDRQKDLDYYWESLSEGGTEQACGWLTDRFGLSWQVVPTELPKLLNHKNPKKAQRAMQAMLQMTKIDIQTLRAAVK